ncbi:MAG TPA: hypothetical protein VNF05_08005 [Acidimicrobiales bacterium]|nr:hypothetical protein [Acidimicrobiales bacterium]
MARTRGATATVLFSLVLLGATGVVSLVAGVAPSAHAISEGLPPCSTPHVEVSVSTSERRYGPGTRVVMRSSARNISTSACNLAVGPTSPRLDVSNVKGVVVWNNCSLNDRIGACALYLVKHRLKPGATYTKTFSWDQRSGVTPVLVPTGTYRMTVRFSGLGGSHATRFQLTRAASPPITVTEANSGESYSLRVGAQLLIQLTGPANYTWSEPATSDASVLERSVGTSGNVATATFVAVSSGSVRVTAEDNPNCYPQCLPPSRLFAVTISVVG